VKDWFLNHLFDSVIAAVLGSGVLASTTRKLRERLRLLRLSYSNPGRLVRAILRLSDELRESRGDTDYYKDRNDEVDEKYDDLRKRFEDLRAQALQAIGEVMQLKKESEERRHLLVDFTTDRESLRVYVQELSDLLQQNNIVVPPAPVLLTRNISTNILKPESAP